MHSIHSSGLEQIKFTLALTIVAAASIKPVAARSLEASMLINSSKKSPAGSHSKRSAGQYHHERIPLDSSMEQDIFGVASHPNYAHDQSERRFSDALCMKSIDCTPSERPLDMESSHNSLSVPLSMIAAEALSLGNSLLLTNDLP